VSVGATVTWTNTDQVPHDATSTAGPAKFTSPTLPTGRAWSYTFTVPGTYSYYCSIHPYMKATILAKAVGVSAAPVGVSAAPVGVSAAPVGSSAAPMAAAGDTISPLYPLLIVLSIVLGAVAISVILTRARGSRT
jgi:copper binding plastocyanin/azurin family protein